MKGLKFIKTKQEYGALQNYALLNPEAFWYSQKDKITWLSNPEKAMYYTQESLKWYSDGMLNVCFNCLDRHVMAHPTKIALIVDNGIHEKRISYSQLFKEVCLMSNMLLESGVKAHDNVSIYLKSSVDIIVAILACNRIGVVHNIIYHKFSISSLLTRMRASKSRFLISFEDNCSSNKKTLSEHLCEHEADCPYLEGIIWLDKKPYQQIRSCKHYYYSERKSELSLISTPIPCHAQDTLFLYYTHDSKGDLEALSYSNAGFLIYNILSFELLFQQEPGDIFWCGHDLSWFEGIALGIYGALGCGSTLYLPTTHLLSQPEKLLQRLEEFAITQAYVKSHYCERLFSNTESQYINEQEKHPEQPQLKTAELSILKTLTLTGERLNPMIWSKIKYSLSNPEVSIKHAFCRPQLGGIILAPWARQHLEKPGCFGYPFPGLDIKIHDEKNDILEPREEGHLAIYQHWPSKPQEIYKISQHSLHLQLLHSTKDYEYIKVLVPGSIDYDGDFWIDDQKQRKEIQKTLLPLRLSEKLKEEFENIPGIKAASLFNMPSEKGKEVLVVFLEILSSKQELSTLQIEKMEIIVQKYFDNDLLLHPILIAQDQEDKDRILATKDILETQTQIGEMQLEHLFFETQHSLTDAHKNP